MSNEIYENKIGIMGAGNIGRALILKLIEHDYPKDNIKLTYNGSIFTFEKIYDNNLVDMISDNARIVDESDIIVLCVPPQSFEQIGDFGIGDDKLVISFMAGITTEEIKKQTGSGNVVRIMPTGPDTIMDSCAIAGVYPSNDIVVKLLNLWCMDYTVLDNEDDMKYMTLIGCMPAVYCKCDYDLPENIEAINKISEKFPPFRQLAEKTAKLAPVENREEFIKNVATPGGVTEKILKSLDDGNNLYDSLMIALNYIDEL